MIKYQYGSESLFFLLNNIKKQIETDKHRKNMLTQRRIMNIISSTKFLLMKLILRPAKAIWVWHACSKYMFCVESFLFCFIWD